MEQHGLVSIYPEEQQAQRTMKLLKTYIVEDSTIIRESLIAALEEMAPIEVVGFAEDEPSAVRWLSTPGNVADLLIVDIFLKLGSGLGVLTAANKLQLDSTLLVLSNHATADMRQKCRELGSDKFYDKSNELDALMAYCERLASGEAGNTAGGEFN